MKRAERKKERGTGELRERRNGGQRGTGTERQREREANIF